MPAKNALRDVNPLALTLCKQGANRQRIFLRKTAVAEKDMLTVAHRMPILKSADEDWTTFYCIVAVPGAEEDPGMVGDPDSVDVWDAGEIRKAAHRLLKNGAFVNLEHDGPAADGVAIVESAVALGDFTVADTTIPEGAWYVGIEPTTAEVRKQIEDGEIEAISLEGSGERVALEKSTVRAPEQDAAAIIAALAKQLGTLGSTERRSSTQEEDMGLAEDFAAYKEETETTLGDLKKSSDATVEAVTGLIGLVDKLVSRVDAAPAAKGDEPPKGDLKKSSDAVEALGKLADKLDEFDGELKKVAANVAALAEGETDQRDADDTIRKSNRNGSDPLAGLLA